MNSQSINYFSLQECCPVFILVFCCFCIAENLNQFEYGSAAFFDNLLPCKGRGYSSSTSDLRTKAGPLSNPSAATNISGAQLSSSTSSLPSSGSHHRQPVCFEDVACPLSLYAITFVSFQM